MNFNSIEFLAFFPLVVFLFFILPHSARWLFLLIASYLFYMSWNPELIFLILLTTIISYVCALLMEKTNSKSKRKLLLALSSVICLGVLFFFKYFNFLSDSVIYLLGLFSLPVSEFSLKLILPVGISFYTFQTMSYVIDVYRGDIKAEKHFGYYALFVSFFPQLVAGPIERPSNLIPQLKEKHSPKFDDFSAGFSKMLIGFFKKIVVADGIAIYVNSVYNNASSATALSVLLATVLFSFQIYCDFSGYTDIAIGAARVLGIRLMQNFDRPYSATTIKDFWSKWHISLSSWFRDYLYIPLGGSRCSKSRHMWNLFFVFIVSGLWHGAAWTFVLWGALHGIYQVIGAITHKTRTNLKQKIGIRDGSLLSRAIGKISVFSLVSFAWIFFRANTVTDLGNLLSILFTKWEFSAEYFNTTIASMGITGFGVIFALLSIVMLHILDSRGISDTGVEEDCGSTSISAFRIVCLFLLIAIVWLSMLESDTASTFIYFQF